MSDKTPTSITDNICFSMMMHGRVKGFEIGGSIQLFRYGLEAELRRWELQTRVSKFLTGGRTMHIEQFTIAGMSDNPESAMRIALNQLDQHIAKKLPGWRAKVEDQTRTHAV